MNATNARRGRRCASQSAKTAPDGQAHRPLTPRGLQTDTRGHIQRRYIHIGHDGGVFAQRVDFAAKSDWSLTNSSLVSGYSKVAQVENQTTLWVNASTQSGRSTLLRVRRRPSSPSRDAAAEDRSRQAGTKQTKRTGESRKAQQLLHGRDGLWATARHEFKAKRRRILRGSLVQLSGSRYSESLLVSWG